MKNGIGFKAILLTGYVLVSWTIHIPQSEAFRNAKAIAEKAKRDSLAAKPVAYRFVHRLAQKGIRKRQNEAHRNQMHRSQKLLSECIAHKTTSKKDSTHLQKKEWRRELSLLEDYLAVNPNAQDLVAAVNEESSSRLDWPVLGPEGWQRLDIIEELKKDMPNQVEVTWGTTLLGSVGLGLSLIHI